MTKTSFDKFEKQDLTRPMDAAWGNGFMKFEKVGDKVEGILRDVFYREAEGIYPEQRGFTLELADGKLKNVSIKRDPYFAVSATDNVRMGDLLTISLTELRETTKGHAAKIFGFESGTLPENASNPTVKELEAKEMGTPSKADEETSPAPEDLPFN